AHLTECLQEALRGLVELVRWLFHEQADLLVARADAQTAPDAPLLLRSRPALFHPDGSNRTPHDAGSAPGAELRFAHAGVIALDLTCMCEQKLQRDEQPAAAAAARTHCHHVPRVQGLEHEACLIVGLEEGDRLVCADWPRHMVVDIVFGEAIELKA